MSPQNLKLLKQLSRKTMLELRNNQPRELVLEKSDRIITNLMSLDEYKKAKVVMLYSGKGNEVQTEKLIRSALKEKRVVLPITNKEKHVLELSEIKDYDKELKVATFNVLEPQKEFIRPVEINMLDLLVIPGVVFDYSGNRIGYGFAYYDKLLAMVQRWIPIIGLAFQFQVQTKIPSSYRDIPVDLIVTEEQIIRCHHYRRRK